MKQNLQKSLCNVALYFVDILIFLFSELEKFEEKNFKSSLCPIMFKHIQSYSNYYNLSLEAPPPPPFEVFYLSECNICDIYKILLHADKFESD